MARLPGDTQLITTTDFTPKFFKELQHGQILGFKQADGTTKHWRVSRIWHKKQQAWLQPWALYDNLDEVEKARKAA